MDNIIVTTDAITGEVTTTVVPYTPEQIAEFQAAAQPAQPTLADLQAQLATLTAQINALGGTK